MDAYQYFARLLWEYDSGDELYRKPSLRPSSRAAARCIIAESKSCDCGIGWSYMSITAFKEYHGKGVHYWPHRELQEEQGLYVN